MNIRNTLPHMRLLCTAEIILRHLTCNGANVTTHKFTQPQSPIACDEHLAHVIYPPITAENPIT